MPWPSCSLSRTQMRVSHLVELEPAQPGTTRRTGPPWISGRSLPFILKTISGEMSVKEACEQLGIGPTQFANLRTRALEGLVDRLGPQPAGRRPRVQVASPREVELMQRNADLERENRLLRAQAEVASLRRDQEATRSKSVGTTVPRPPAPRADAAGGAVP